MLAGHLLCEFLSSYVPITGLELCSPVVLELMTLPPQFSNGWCWPSSVTGLFSVLVAGSNSGYLYFDACVADFPEKVRTMGGILRWRSDKP